MLFLWLDSVDLAIERVSLRVKEGGHGIPEETIRRRYERGKNNFLQLYLPLADTWKVYDNSFGEPIKISEKIKNETIIHHNESWEKFTEGVKYDLR